MRYEWYKPVVRFTRLPDGPLMRFRFRWRVPRIVFGENEPNRKTLVRRRTMSFVSELGAIQWAKLKTRELDREWHRDPITEAQPRQEILL